MESSIRLPVNFSYNRIKAQNFSFSSAPNANRRSTTPEITWKKTGLPADFLQKELIKGMSPGHENSPKVFNRKEIGEFYYVCYYAIQAMVQAGGNHDANWYPQIRDVLIGLQKPDGSWREEEVEIHPHKTPMAIIILGPPHCYIPVYQR